MEISFPIAEHLPEPVFLLGEQGRKIIWINSAAETWLQRSNDTVSGLSLDEISSGFEEIVDNAVKSARDSSIIHGHDISVGFKNQRNYMCSYLIFRCPLGVAVMVKPNKPIAFENIQHTARGKSVTMLSRMLSHELKNPLAGIYGAAQLLENELKNPDDLELTSLIKTEVNRIGRLTEQMEKFEQSSFGEHLAFNVHSILRRAILLFQSQGNDDVVLSENYDPSLPLVFGDEDALMQVVVNLIANAIEAIKKRENHGSIIQGRVEVQTLYRAGVRQKNSAGIMRTLPIEVRVIDNGIGIDTDIRERIFQPFVTSKANGHGLGLALVSKIISEHGGVINLKSHADRTIFSVLLPIQKTKA